MIQVSPKNRTKAREKYQSWQEEERKRSLIIQPSPEVLAARKSLAAFRKYVCNHDTYPIHDRWEAHLNTGEDSKVLRGIAGRNTLLLSWRGSSKSTFTLEWVAFQLGRHIEAGILFKILLVSFNLEVAMLKSEQLQNIVASDRFSEIFPKCRKSRDKWAHKIWAVDFAVAGLTLTEEPYTLAAAGITGSTASKRAHLIVFDDIIPSPKAIANPQIRKEMIQKWKSVIKPCLYDGGRAICLAARMAAGDIFDDPEGFTEPNWNVITESALAIDPDTGEECSAWGVHQHLPFAQSTQFLLKYREDAPLDFSFQYMNVVVRVEGNSISPEFIHRDILPDRLESLVLGVDLSAGDRQVHDYTSMMLGGLELRGKVPHFWMIDAWQGRIMGNIEKLDKMIELWDTWKHLLPQTNRFNSDGELVEVPVTGLQVHFESNAYQLSMKGDYESYVIGQKGIYDWNVVKCPSVNDKLVKLRSLTGVYENGLISYNIYGRLMGVAIDQIVSFGSTAHDDMMDAQYFVINALRTYRPLATGNY